MGAKRGLPWCLLPSTCYFFISDCRRGMDAAPELGFAGMPVGAETVENRLERRLGDAVAWVGGEFGPQRAGEGPAGPGTPRALVAPRGVHAVGVVLEMDAGIAEKNVRRRVAQQPDHCAVRQRPGVEHGLVAIQFRAKRSVEAEHRAGGEAALPEGVRVLQAVVIELGAAFVLAMDVQRPPVETRPRIGKIRANRHHSGRQ